MKRLSLYIFTLAVYFLIFNVYFAQYQNLIGYSAFIFWGMMLIAQFNDGSIGYRTGYSIYTSQNDAFDMFRRNIIYVLLISWVLNLDKRIPVLKPYVYLGVIFYIWSWASLYIEEKLTKDKEATTLSNAFAIIAYMVMFYFKVYKVYILLPPNPESWIFLSFALVFIITVLFVGIDAGKSQMFNNVQNSWTWIIAIYFVLMWGYSFITNTKLINISLLIAANSIYWIVAIEITKNFIKMWSNKDKVRQYAGLNLQRGLFITIIYILRRLFDVDE